jgi:hypothetical protein
MRQEAESAWRATIDRKVAGSSHQLAHYPGPFAETGCLGQREESLGGASVHNGAFRLHGPCWSPYPGD